MDLDVMTKRVRQFLEANFPAVRRIGPDDPLLDRGVIDSLGILSIVGFLESEFHITLADEELVPENFHSVNRLASFAKSKLNGVVGKE